MLKPSRGNNFVAFVLVFTYLIAFVALPPFTRFITNLNIKMANEISLTIFLQVAGLFLPVVFYFILTKQPINVVIPLKRLSFTNCVLIFLIMMFSIPFVAVISSASSLIFGEDVSMAIVEMSKYPFYQVVLASCVCPAIFEELIMRGVVLSNYKAVNIRKAAFCNGILFGVLHLNFEQFFYAFFLGYLFAYFVYYTKSIWAAVVSHFLINFTSSFFAYTFYSEQLKSGVNVETLFEKLPFNEQVYNLLQLSLFAAFTSAIGFVLLKYFIAYNKRKNMEEEINSALIRETDIESPAVFVHESRETLTIGFWVCVFAFLATVALSFL